MKTSIIILTHSQLAITKQCLGSIYKHTPEPIEIIVVDNNSTDETVEYLKTQPDIKTIFNEKNQGFARGCNQGYEISTGDTILFLNNDTVVTENWLANMLRLLYSNEKIGLVGPVTNNISGNQQIAASYQDLFSGLENFSRGHCKWNSRCHRRVLRLVGFCLLVKRKVLDEIGVFDERFGLGNYEDDDLCLRAVKSGWHLMIALDAYIHHIGSVTFNHCADTVFRNLLFENKQKAIEKWGFDIAPYLLNTNPVITISLCMLVKNAQATLQACLDSVKDVVDEIIIVDYGSDDLTKKIAEEYTQKIYDYDYKQDKAAVRNFAFSQATMEYILWLNVDEKVLDGDREKLLKLKDDLTQSIDAVAMHNSSGRLIYRLVKRLKNFQWFGAENEYLAVGGDIAKSDVTITSINAETQPCLLNISNDKKVFLETYFLPQEMFAYAGKLLEEGKREKASRVYEDFLDAEKGWIEENILACGRIADIYNHLGDQEKELEYIYKSFKYAGPRAEFCCRLGFKFLGEGSFQHAVYWYKLASELKKPLENYGLISSCWTWLPHLQLCICYDKLGMPELAYKHNEIARTYLPNDPKILYNRKYLKSILYQEETSTPLSFVTLFPETENVHLCKDVGIIPYLLHKKFNLHAKVACYKNGDYPYLNNLVEGLKLDFINKETGDPFLDGAAYLRDNAKNIDILNLYHFLDRTLEWAKIYKSLNPEGKIFFKLDANEWHIKQFDINATNINGSHSILKACDLISVETTELHNYLNEHWPLKIEYLPNGFYDFDNRKQVAYQDKENVICTVGRIGSYLKASEILMQAFKIAAPCIPDWKLKIIGPIEKPFEAYIEKFFEENPELAEKIIFMGEITDKDVLQAEYQKAKIFCMTSRLESFGLVFAEAASNGCFIVTSDVISANDVTGNEKYGDIFKKDNVIQLAELLVKDCQDEVRLASVCNEIQDYAYKNFYWVNICANIYKLLTEE